MSPIVYPPNPTFKSSGERSFFDALVNQLSESDIVFANFKMADDEAGDIEIDFAVLIKDYGLIVFEVKGGHISHDGTRWLQAGPNGTFEIDPAGQAVRAVHTLQKYITNRWSLGPLRSSWLVAFPFSDITDPRDPALPIGKMIQKRQMGNILSQIKNVSYAERKIPIPDLENWVEFAANNLLPIVAHKTSPQAVLGNNYEYIRSLTHERDIILKQLAENTRYYVKGPAGSGKTWLAFEQARIWTAEGKKVALLSFADGLASYFHRKNSELEPSQQIDFIGSFMDFAIEIGSDAGEYKDYDLSDDPHRARLVEAAIALSPEAKYDAILVDEAQDFFPSWWETLELCLKDRATSRLALFGDDNQQVFGFRPPPKGHFAHLRLYENLRNSQQIARAVSKLINVPTIARGPRSFEIELVAESDTRELQNRADDQVAYLVDKENWSPREVVLLTTKSRHDEHRNRVNFDEAEYWRSFWEEEEVFYCTVGGFKGLERPVVILQIDGFHEDADPKNVLYVGMTRARDKLVVVGPPKYLTIVEEVLVDLQTRLSPPYPLSDFSSRT